MAMSGRAFVFLGPSLSPAEAKSIVDAELLPPVRRGDVLRLLPERPCAIGIVDGYFDSVRSVWHKEILAAMQAGTHVFGAASMGALRAAELSPFGMVGVGEIFEWYRDGVIDADDEVAIVHGPEETGCTRISDALVDIRDVCRAAHAAGVIRDELATKLVNIAVELHYPDRSMPLVIARARESGADPSTLDALERFAAGYGPGLKERDARALLSHLAAFLDGDPAPLRVDYHVERTVFLERLEHEVELRRAAGIEALPADADPLDATGESLAVLRKKVLFRLLARREAERIGLRVDDAEMQRAVDEFRRRFGLLSAADTHEWARQAGVTNEMFVEMIRDGVLVEKLQRIYGHRIEAGLPAQIGMSSARRYRREAT